MKRAFAAALVALYFAILALPAANMALGWIHEPPLAGVSAPVVRPAPTAYGFKKERFRKGCVAWFEAFGVNYGLRATAVRLDSSLDYYVFREAPAESRVRVGSDLDARDYGCGSMVRVQARWGIDFQRNRSVSFLCGNSVRHLLEVARDAAVPRAA